MKKDKKNAEVEPTLFELADFTMTPEESETQLNAFNYKIDDVKFWGVMVAALGIPNKAVKIFMRDFNIKISRQAVSVRANKHPARLEECRELIIDTAEEIGLYLLTQGDKRTQAEIYKHITGTLGKRRGYTKQLDVNNSGEVKLTSVKVEHVSTGVPLATSEKEIDDAKK